MVLGFTFLLLQWTFYNIKQVVYKYNNIIQRFHCIKFLNCSHLLLSAKAFIMMHVLMIQKVYSPRILSQNTYT